MGQKNLLPDGIRPGSQTGVHRTLDEWLASLVGPTGRAQRGLVFDGTYPP